MVQGVNAPAAKPRNPTVNSTDSSGVPSDLRMHAVACVNAYTQTLRKWSSNALNIKRKTKGRGRNKPIQTEPDLDI